MNGSFPGQHPSPDRSISLKIKSGLNTIVVIVLASIAAILTCFAPAIKMVLSAYILAQL